MQPSNFRLPPPPGAVSFRTDALDEVRAFVARFDGEHSRVAHGTGALGYEWHAIAGRDTVLRWSHTALGQTIRGALGAAVLHLSIDGAGTYAFGRRRIHVGPGEAVFIAPGWEFTRISGPGCVVALGFDRAVLAAEIDARRSRAGPGALLGSMAVAMPPADKAAVAAAIGGLVAAAGSTSASRRRDLAEGRAVSLVADLLLRGGAAPDATAPAAARIASLEAWIEAHLGEPITLGRLCNVADVGPRSLQAAFMSVRGVSPMRFVVERRLAAARDRLRRAGPDGDVTSAAVDAGFSHLGRFATLYRQVYGESPSQTLRDRPR